MIKKITISNIASYTEQTSLETDKKINLVYGLNGAGKTIISNYLKDLNNPDFASCQIEGFDPEQQKILVYNQQFVGEIFYTEKPQRGIFNLTKDNKDALKNISKAEETKKPLEENLTNTRNSLNEKEAEIKQLQIAAKEKTWEIKTKYTGGDRVFDKAGFLDGLKGDKQTLFNHLIDIPLEETTRTIEELKKELQDLGENAAPRDEIPHLQPGKSAQIENDPVFQEKIIGSQSSSVSGLIERLGNSDWVRRGLNYLDDTTKCPFCQQPTLTLYLKKEIRDYFDETYQNKINELKALEQDYRSFVKGINEQNYTRDFFDGKQKADLDSLFEKLIRILNNNLNKIQTKTASASQVITLESTKKIIGEINNFISEQNAGIKSFNQKINNREQTIRDLKDQFWKVLRKQDDGYLSWYKQQKSKLKADEAKINSHLKALEQQVGEQNRIISENQIKVTSIDPTIDAINSHLLDFGIQDFTIIKHDKNSYRIQRGGETQDKPVFKSLSEGEKTVISFLYFVELCKGKDAPNDTKEKIIVIDDPISSMSHMYVFNVAQLIKSTLLNPIIEKQEKKPVQCFILTHNLYFFHELIFKKQTKKQTKPQKDQKLFRITKDNKSSICEMDIDDIKNEYEEYWYIVKTASQGNIYLVANAMRNILEYFFGFIDRTDDWREIFNQENFSDTEFQPFIRYMDRESHSDLSNRSEYKEFNLDIFKKAFRKVFQLTKHEAHYETYMGSQKQ